MGEEVKKLYLALTIDVDPDNYDPSIFGVKGMMSWQGVDVCLNDFIRQLEVLKSKWGRSPRLTWFIRADQEIQKEHDSAGYLFEKYERYWKDFVSQGHELAWHPHDRLLSDIRKSYQDLKALGHSFFSVRIGESFHSNDLMAELDAWGFQIDSTALPGRARQDQDRVFDWLPTPQEPYFPSMNDYRKPGNPSRKILEVPMTMIGTRAPYDQDVVKRYLNLSYRPEILNQDLGRVIVEQDLVVTILHPSELLTHPQEHSLLSFRMDAIMENLMAIQEHASRCKKELEFITVFETIHLIKKGMIKNGQPKSEKGVRRPTGSVA